MRSLFDRGPNDNYMPPSIIKPVRGLAVPSGGGAVIERTMLNRESRQSGTMRGAGGMGFINRGSSLGTGIDYGTFSGKGAGGARFYGEGVVHLKTGAAIVCPFDVSVGGKGGNKVKVRPGTLNGLYATNYANCLSFDSTPLTLSATSNVVLSVTTDGKQVTAYTIEMQASLTAMSPTTPLAPTAFKWPIAHIISGTVYKTIDCGSLQAVVKENVRVAKTPSTPDDNAYDIYYYWVMETV